MRRFLPVISLVVVLALPQGAAAQRNCEAPPGTAAVEQYCETIPSATGDKNADARPDRPVPLPAGTAEELARSGEDGAALLRQLGYDPAKVKEQARENRAETPATPPANESVPKEPTFNVFETVGQAISSGPTVGSGFMLMMLAITLLMLGWGWVDYRRRSTSQD